MVTSVGRSSYGELNGVEQFVATQEIADQVASLCYEFDTTVAHDGDRLTVNEGIRSRERQTLLYGQYLRGGVLAAYPFTSTHDASRGSALDFGITSASGVNRALTQGEFDWLHARGAARGIQWTGRYFARVEQWHHNGGYAAQVPPIAGVNRPGEPFPGIEDDMTPEQDARQQRIEKMLTELAPVVKALQTKTDQTYDRLGRNPKDTASEVWKYRIPDTTGTKTSEARVVLAYVDKGKASGNVGQIADAVASKLNNSKDVK